MTDVDHYRRLCALLDGDVLADERMDRHTTFHIGGPARVFIACQTLNDLSRAIDYAQDNHIPWRVVGKGSNILCADSGYDGIVITLGAEFRKFTYLEGGRLVAGGGANLGRLVNDAFGKCLSGLEFGIGIPGTVGGAVFMNAGVHDAWVAQTIESVTVLRPGRGLFRYRPGDLPWYYRSAGIPDDEIIVEATFAVHEEDGSTLHKRMEDVLSSRREHQPGGYSAGSVFRNPSGFSAGQLIEEAGLKGTRCGGAQISPKHANFIINVEDATAGDVLELINLAHDRVKEIHGIELEPEVRFLGFPQ